MNLAIKSFHRIFVITALLLITASSCFAEKLMPLPRAIGSNDGEWTYLGRFVSTAPANVAIHEWEIKLQPYNSTEGRNDLYDVYYFHSHYGDGDGAGCTVYRMPDGEILPVSFSCVLKTVPLDKNGQRLNKTGLQNATLLISMFGAPKCIYVTNVKNVRAFDSYTHQLIGTYTYRNNPNMFKNFDYYSLDHKIEMNSPFFKAKGNQQNCPVIPYDGSMG